MILPLLLLVVWVVTGILVLLSKKVSKGDYAVVWGLLIMYLLFDLFETIWR